MNATSIQQRASRILQMPSKSDELARIETMIKNVAYHQAQYELEVAEKLAWLEKAYLDRILTPKEASKVLSLTADMVRRNIETGKLGGEKLGGRWKTTYAHILDYMQSRPKKYGESITLQDIVKFD